MAHSRARLTPVLGALMLLACGGDDEGGGGGGGVGGSPSVDAGGGDPGGPGAPASCSALTGSWKVTAWMCAGSPIDFDAAGVEITATYSDAASGLETTRFFVPAGQSTTWYARSHGRSVSTSGSALTFTRAAPSEQCSTNTVADADWGPVTTGVGQQTCLHRPGAPGAGDAIVLTCAAKDSHLELTHVGSVAYGPCGAGEASVETWRRQ